jgi:phage shock protein PspC (stress-responsive transcriptional regulator)
MTNEPTAHEPATGGEQRPAAPGEPTGAQSAEATAGAEQPTQVLGPTVAEASDLPAEPSDLPAEPSDLSEPGPTPAEAGQPRYTGPPRDDARLAGGAFPPPAGAGYQPPDYPGYQPPGYPSAEYQPPSAEGWAARRYGLVRPSNGRVFAGVCAAIGRATNTDPVLWRVLLAVFTLVGGVGLLAYVVGWLLIPAEGDTASPIEALIGRGRSSTSPFLVVVVTIIVAITMGSVVTRGIRSSGLPVAIVILAIILLARRARHNGPAGAGSAPPPGQPPLSGQPPLPGQTPASAPVPGQMPGPGPAAQVPFAATTGPAVATGPGQPAPAGYRPPFAPHGPYAMGSRYPYPGLAFNPTVEVAPAPAPPARRRRSRLGLVFFALALVAVGIIALVDLGGARRIPVGAYLAVPLAIIGAGLVIGAWSGRARGLIVPGVLLTLALAAPPAHLNVNVERGTGDVTWVPASYADLAPEYRHGVGDARLDLSQIDFTGHDATVVLHTNVGDVWVTLPQNVDTTVDVTIKAGDANVFKHEMSGVGMGTRTVSDEGPDGPGGGHLHLIVQLDLGSLKVER